MNQNVTRFRKVALLEGVSFLLILFITMPLKYTDVSEIPNKIVGALHGLLFVLYLILALPVKKDLNWSFKILFIVFIASVIPFGTFYMERKYLRNEQ